MRAITPRRELIDTLVVDREEQLIQARREEAQALFREGQATKARTDRILGFGLAATGVAATAGIANNFSDVMLAVPTALALLMAYVFQMYADLIAHGIARKRIEEVLREQLRDDALIVEMVAPARHGGLANPSIPLTQSIYVLLVIGAAIAGGERAYRLGTWPTVLYLAATLLSITAAIVSWNDQRRTWRRSSKLVASYAQR